MQHLLPCTMPTSDHSEAATSYAGLQVKPPGNQSWDWSEKQHRLVWRHKKVQGGTEHTLKVSEQAAQYSARQPAYSPLLSCMCSDNQWNSRRLGCSCLLTHCSAALTRHLRAEQEASKLQLLPSTGKCKQAALPPKLSPAGFSACVGASLQVRAMLEDTLTTAVRRGVGPVSLNFTIPNHCASRLLVRYLQILKTDKNYSPYRWVRYVTVSNSYIIRTH